MEDLVYLAAGTLSSAIILVSAFKARRSYGLRHGYQLDPFVFKLRDYMAFKPLGRAYSVDLGFLTNDMIEGVWQCVKAGSGGWGIVYKCSRGGRNLAVKVPIGYTELIEGGELPTVDVNLLRRVAGEAERVKVLSEQGHPGVLRLITYSRKAPLLVYEWADGGSLEYQVSRGWKPSLREALIVAMQVADTLRYLHSRGLVHGDVKPSNVLIAGGVAKLGDFSSLKSLLQRITTATAFTPGWRAPEQVYSDLRRRAEERGFENRVDVYQLGNLLLWMLTRESIDGEERVGRRGRERLERLLNRVDERVREVLERMLAEDPLERPTADEAFKTLSQTYMAL